MKDVCEVSVMCVYVLLLMIVVVVFDDGGECFIAMYDS